MTRRRDAVGDDVRERFRRLLDRADALHQAYLASLRTAPRRRHPREASAER